jgi:hypothetical protein
MLLEMLEGVISLETFPFVEQHQAELTNVPSLTPIFCELHKQHWYHSFQQLTAVDFENNTD